MVANVHKHSSSGSLLLLHTVSVCSAAHLAAMAADVCHIYKIESFLGF